MTVRSGFWLVLMGFRPSLVSRARICWLSYWFTLQPSVSMAKVCSMCYTLVFVSRSGKVNEFVRRTPNIKLGG